MRTADVITTTEGPYALRMPQEPQRAYICAADGVVAISGQPMRTAGTGRPTRERIITSVLSLAANVQYRQPQRTSSAKAPQKPQSGLYHAGGHFIGQAIKTHSEPF